MCEGGATTHPTRMHVVYPFPYVFDQDFDLMFVRGAITGQVHRRENDEMWSSSPPSTGSGWGSAFLRQLGHVNLTCDAHLEQKSLNENCIYTANNNHYDYSKFEKNDG